MAEDVTVCTATCDKTPPAPSVLGRPGNAKRTVRRLHIPGMRLTLSLFDLFHGSQSAGKGPVKPDPNVTSTPLAEMDDSVPTMGLWSGAMMLLALGFSRNRLPRRQRAAGMAKRATRRCDA